MAVTRSQTRKLPAKKTPNEGQARPELQARKPKQSPPEPHIARPLQTTITTPTMLSDVLPKPNIAADPQQVSRQAEKTTRITEKAAPVRPESSGKKRAATDSDKSGNRVAKKSPRTAVPTISGAWPSSLGNPRRRGLQNPANWCYRRSVLQSLFSTPQFFNVLADHEPGTCPRNCVTCGLRTALRTYHSNSPQLGGHVRQLDERIHATGRKSDPRWTANGHTQEDAHDFLTYLLGTVEGVKGTTQANIQQTYHIAHQASWTCNNCRRTHTSSDPSGWSISIPIQPRNGQATLQTCIDAYHAEPRLEIRCDNCRTNGRRQRERKIRTLPEVLNLHLMRFAINDRGRAAKLDHRVQIPEEIDMARWTLPGQTRTRYRLNAAVMHAGRINSGHYIARVRDGNRIVEFDDQSMRTRPTWWANVRDQHGAFTPYILVYIRQ